MIQRIGRACTHRANQEGKRGYSSRVFCLTFFAVVCAQALVFRVFEGKTQGEKVWSPPYCYTK